MDYNGTPGDDKFVGTNADDSFTFSDIAGFDTVDGGGGVDTLIFDLATKGIGKTIDSDGTSYSGLFQKFVADAPPTESIKFSNVEVVRLREEDDGTSQINVTLSGRNAACFVDLNYGGGGFSSVFADLKYLSSAIDSEGIATTDGARFGGFDLYSLDLGAGANTVINDWGRPGLSVRAHDTRDRIVRAGVIYFQLQDLHKDVSLTVSGGEGMFADGGSFSGGSFPFDVHFTGGNRRNELTTADRGLVMEGSRGQDIARIDFSARTDAMSGSFYNYAGSPNLSGAVGTDS